METIDIKQYLEMNTEKKITNKKPTKYIYEIIFENGSDFIIERTTGKVKRQLCFIADKNLLFIRDPKTNNDQKIEKESQIKDFFKNYYHIDFVFLKNDYFNYDNIGDFAYNVYKLTRNNIYRQFVKYGLNPDKFLKDTSYYNNYQDAFKEYDFNIVLKVAKKWEPYMENKKNKRQEENTYVKRDCFLLFLVYIYTHFCPDYVDTFLKIYYQYDSFFYPNMYHYNSPHWIDNSFNKLVNGDYNFDFERLLVYLFRDLYSEGIDKIDDSLLDRYRDILDLQITVYGKIKEKYPEHFKETHDKLVLKYNLNKEYFLNKKIEKFNNYNKALEYKDDQFIVFPAKTSQELINEGVNLHHCVGSYVNRVANAECAIFFLRKTRDIDTSLITIELRDNNRIVQVRGLCERLMDDNERSFIKKWCKNKGLVLENE